MNSVQQAGIVTRLKGLLGLGRNRRAGRDAHAIYGQAVARARAPALYEGFGVTDTPDGRYEMIAWQVIIELNLLAARGKDGRRLGQEVVDLMFADMDRSLRELGVGDLSVGRQMGKLGETWQARIALAERLLPGHGPVEVSPAGGIELARFLERNAGGAGRPVDGAGLVAHLLGTLARLRAERAAG